MKTQHEITPDETTPVSHNLTSQALKLSQKFMYYSTPFWDNGPPMRIDGAIMTHVLLLNSVMSRRSNRELEPFDLTFNQFLALGCVGHEAEGITHSQLGQRLMISKTPVTSVVDRLVKLGYVRRETDESDRRISRILITPQGRERWQEVHNHLMESGPPEMPMTEDEQLLLLRLLANLLSVVAKDDPFVTELREAPDPPEATLEIFEHRKQP